MPATISLFLNVTDIQRSLDFYQRLGFKLDKAWKDKETGIIGFADLSAQGAELGLGNIASNDDPEFREWVGTPLGAGVVVYVTVPDVDAWHARAKKAGATIEYGPLDRPYGRVFMLNDPDGYSISFITEPKAPRRKPATTSKRSKKAGAGRQASAKKSSKKSAKKKAPAKKRGAASKRAKAPRRR